MLVISFRLNFPDPPGTAGVYMLRNRYNKRTYIGSSKDALAMPVRKWVRKT